MAPRILSFEPVFDGAARTLILGTMPSVESLRQGFYYGHPRNAFWPILSEVFAQPRPTTVEEKRALLLMNGIALWDVACSCEREGSLDSAIREPLPNAMERIYAACPGIDRLLFNGQTAEKLYRRLIGPTPAGVEARVLPSTSPAYTLDYATKRLRWQAALDRDK